ncbi:hypothetical protein FN846DRAFT_936504 [Sphaerosporella brunnea]|uniref:Uncharacterized protein n=1 Tax=Sphaerosporella brunnea TaxID=1250544 RepID=A0A5J5F4K8_9PEZI|nr:hypothetical protein FN846DRAFT_936504 [Sphaerosporella brunnea]
MLGRHFTMANTHSQLLLLTGFWYSLVPRSSCLPRLQDTWLPLYAPQPLFHPQAISPYFCGIVAFLHDSWVFLFLAFPFLLLHRFLYLMPELLRSPAQFSPPGRLSWSRRYSLESSVSEQNLQQLDRPSASSSHLPLVFTTLSAPA